MAILGWVVALLLAAPAAAQVCTREQTWTMEPVARDTYAVRFLGRSLSGASVNLILRKKVTADATPNAMIVAGPSISGDTVTVALSPNQGCEGGTSCRAGNEYQIRVQATDAEENTPTANVCLVVETQTLRTGGTR